MVVAFEPDKTDFIRLKENIRLNKLKIVILINNCLWSDCETLTFKKAGGTGSSFLQISLSSKSTSVDVVFINTEFKRLNLKKFDFVKTDIEGAELRSVKGTFNIIKKRNVNFSIASYYFIDREQTFYDLEMFFNNKNFSFTEFPDYLTTYAHNLFNYFINKFENSVFLINFFNYSFYIFFS